MTVKIETHPERVDLILKREVPARSWPEGRLMEWEKFSFPLRCWTDVMVLYRQCRNLSPAEARVLVKGRRRAIQWP